MRTLLLIGARSARPRGLRRIFGAADADGRDAHRDGRAGRGQHDLEGYSPASSRTTTASAHEHADDAAGNIEAEYHQPPKPAEAGLGEAIELTGTEIGVRFHVTVTDVKPLDDELMAVYVKLESTGIAIYDRPMEQATITYPGEDPTPLDTDASAECSNGFDGILRIDVLPQPQWAACCSRGPATRCPSASSSRSRSCPTEAGGIWNLQ